MLSYLKRNIGPIAVILIFALLFLGDVARIKPYDADNLIALSFGKLSAANLFEGSFTNYLPAYRPLSKIAVYLQYQLGGVSQLQNFFWGNWLMWTGCAVGLYVLLENITTSRLASLLGAVGMLLDPRAIFALVWIGERQNTICLLAGLVALYIAFTLNRKTDYKKILLINLFLFLSLLSKEFGLAFTIPVLLVVLRRTKNYLLALSVLFSFLFYMVARLTLGVSSNDINSFCETMGYFDKTLEICYSGMGIVGRIKQYLYNTGASFIGTFLPLFFSRVGTLSGINFTLGFYMNFAFSVLILVPSIIALAKKYKDSTIFLLLIVLSAFANFILFRERNQLIGMLGFYALFGIGLSQIFKKIKMKFIKVGIAYLIIISTLCLNGLDFRREIQYFVGTSEKNDPCRALEKYPQDIDKTIVQTVSNYYKLNLNCLNK
ncbi:MAG: hypothetical protein BWY43_00223 [candidate division WS2 bacterium ADurb.Bin280]|uniref:Glycosyltransferase RgtA/B/C/D-like domain-containing protein n=1 Tax=candidate division WS2 bacterium ADurb.Bin280 TaxID=1852829 RepID=A0A1V5SET9_9BACT|nr:MAG: hypothetical protein BWY43_00223 [candidate division WS2 bacterium ADurb.Bin280]